MKLTFQFNDIDFEMVSLSDDVTFSNGDMYEQGNEIPKEEFLKLLKTENFYFDLLNSEVFYFDLEVSDLVSVANIIGNTMPKIKL